MFLQALNSLLSVKKQQKSFQADKISSMVCLYSVTLGTIERRLFHCKYENKNKQINEVEPHNLLSFSIQESELVISLSKLDKYYLK